MRSITIFCLLVIYISYTRPATTNSLTSSDFLSTREPVCARNSPRVCGRNRQGVCRRFASICRLIETNEQGRTNWVHTRDLDCRNIRGSSTATAQCYHPCPRDPLKCLRTPVRNQLCLISRSNRSCRIVENNCALINLNCHTIPRNQWRRTGAGRCRNLVLNDKPRPCVALPPRTTTVLTSSEGPESSTMTTIASEPITTGSITTTEDSAIITTMEPIVTTTGPLTTTVDPTTLAQITTAATISISTGT